MTPHLPPRPLTVQECADILRVSKMTILRRIHSGELPAFRVRRQFRVPANEWDRYLRGAAVDAEWGEE